VKRRLDAVEKAEAEESPLLVAVTREQLGKTHYAENT
jgi:hypothetical protein